MASHSKPFDTAQLLFLNWCYHRKWETPAMSFSVINSDYSEHVFQANFHEFVLAMAADRFHPDESPYTRACAGVVKALPQKADPLSSISSEFFLAPEERRGLENGVVQYILHTHRPLQQIVIGAKHPFPIAATPYINWLYQGKWAQPWASPEISFLPSPHYQAELDFTRFLLYAVIADARQRTDWQVMFITTAQDLVTVSRLFKPGYSFPVELVPNWLLLSAKEYLRYDENCRKSVFEPKQPF